MKRLATLWFWFVFAVTTALLGLCARQLSPGVAEQVRPEVFAFRDKFLASYGPVSLDIYILAHDILGAARQVRKQDVMVLGSSKAMYGVNAGTAGRLLQAKGIKAGFYNLAFGRGEGLVFPAWLIEQIGVRDKLVVVDATDNTSQYHVELVGQQAMKSSLLEAWKLVIETNIRYRLDWVLDGLLPRGTIGSQGITLEPTYLRPALWRDWHTGDVVTGPGPNAHLASPGTFPFDFDVDHRLRENIFSTFRSSNLDFGFVSIPYTGHDPKWAQRAALSVGCWYLPLRSDSLYTIDSVHLNMQSRELLTQRLVEGMTADSFGLANRLVRLHSTDTAKSNAANPEGRH
jgi:hypothetical protein